MTNSGKFTVCYESAFRIVCLCGSVSFKDKFLEVAQQLEFEGCIVVMPNVFSKADGIPLSEEKIALLTQIHEEKLKLCHEIFVVDAPGKNGKPYIGVATKREIAIAESLNKPVRYLSDKKKKVRE
jgi:hypothetical protein